MWCPPRRDGLGGIFVCRVSNFPINLVHTHVAVVAGERSKTDDVHFHAPTNKLLYKSKQYIIIVIIRKGKEILLLSLHRSLVDR